jgi:lipoprotein-releasing system ATP-binding protein
MMDGPARASRTAGDGDARAPLIETRAMTKLIGEEIVTTLVRDIDLAIYPGEFVAVTGPSGSGKSSLLYLLGLLDVPTSGEVLIEGRAASSLDEVARAKLRLSLLGFVFQFHFLLPEFTAIDNVMLPMRALGRLNDEQRRARALELLSSLGLAEHAWKRPGQLSGGQRQRVAIARALANDPLVILADEPTGNLDTASSEQVLTIFRRLVDETGRAIVFVTHDLSLAARADRQIHIVDGRIERDDQRSTGPNA